MRCSLISYYIKMKRLLEITHWQLFLISWGIVTLFFIGLLIKPILIGQSLLIWIILFPVALINCFTWVWSTVKVLIATIPAEVRPKTKLFKICFWIPAIYTVYILAFMYFNLFVRKVPSLNADLELKMHSALILLSSICILYGLSFAARIIKTAELRRNVNVYEYLPEFALMLFAPIGLWIIQPRLNKLVI
jgi:hypothetical protein